MKKLWEQLNKWSATFHKGNIWNISYTKYPKREGNLN